MTQKEIALGFERLNLVGARAVVHSSFKSFGSVVGGPGTALEAIRDTFRTILMPAFCWDSNCPPPAEDRPRRNGCDYAYYANWTKPMIPFCSESAGVERSMGVLSRLFVSRPGVFRSDHSWHSWAAYGDGAQTIVADHSWDEANTPLKKLADQGGWVILIGVGLSSCTAIHLAEEKAGRKPFIRWVMDRNGGVRRVRASGCAKGFDKIFSYCKDLFRETTIGSSRILAAPLKALIERAGSIITREPEITRCSDICLRCRDAILGGPLEAVSGAGHNLRG